ncbi:response regulator [Pedobacter sp. SYSU D00535]|uniref:response regulator n=1 Tax=Pedobacter sp. SYSU D00535 TaxID=2810308 RepID=UPI001A962EDA|nr:response regulator [Pedobacter sp. SYSU D00535]
MKRVLIVDDDSDIIDLVSLILEEAGFQVIVSSQQSLIKDIYRYKPGLILYDGWKKQKEDFQVLSQVKRDKICSRIPIILFSTATDLPSLAQAYQTDSYLDKPFELDQLVDAVRNCYNLQYQ